MSSPILSAIKQISEEKGISPESVVATIEAALAAAFRKDFGDKLQNIKVEFDPKTGGSRVFDVKTVMEAPPEEEIMEAAGEEGEKSEGASMAPAEKPWTTQASAGGRQLAKGADSSVATSSPGTRSRSSTP